MIVNGVFLHQIKRDGSDLCIGPVLPGLTALASQFKEGDRIIEVTREEEGKFIRANVDNLLLDEQFADIDGNVKIVNLTTVKAVKVQGCRVRWRVPCY